MNFAQDNAVLFATAIFLAVCSVPVYFIFQWLRSKWQERKKQDES